MEYDNKRTIQQNKAQHLWFEMFAEELNNAGLDMRAVLKPGVDIPWTKDSFKEHIYKPILKAMLNKNSTTEQTTKDIDLAYDTINRHFSEKFGIHVPFPSIENHETE